MQRRKFLKIGLGTGVGMGLVSTLAWHQLLDGPISNACQIDHLPHSLSNHPLMLKAFDGLDMSALWDTHFHLLGNGLNAGFDDLSTGAWLNPNMSSWMSPIQKIQYKFYLNAACIGDKDFADKQYITNINQIIGQLPAGIRMMLLAFDYQHDAKGNKLLNASTFHIPNEYAAKVASTSESFEWFASVHPYRTDAIEMLHWCKENGARGVKWLPPAMNIDPASSKCTQFYNKLVELKLPLLTHAGDEKAVHSEELQKLSNPLLLRKPLDLGVKVIVAHCASLGSNQDLDNKQSSDKSNFDLFARLMNDNNYQDNCLADISAINLINRQIIEIKQIIENQDWHSRLLYASDYPLPGVMPIISSKNLADHGLIDKSAIPFVNQVRQHNSWLYDFLIKRMMKSNGVQFDNAVFQTRKHFL